MLVRITDKLIVDTHKLGRVEKRTRVGRTEPYLEVALKDGTRIEILDVSEIERIWSVVEREAL